MTVEASPRQDIKHLEAIPNALSFVQSIAWSSQFFSMPCRVKYDGVSMRFGKSDKSAWFVETARSGPIYDPNEFFAHLYKNTKRTDPLWDMKYQRAKDYHLLAVYLFQMIERLEGTKQEIPNGAKVFVECLPHWMMQPGTRKVVHIDYTKLPVADLNMIAWKFEGMEKWTTYDLDEVNELRGKHLKSPTMNFIEDRFWSNRFDIGDLIPTFTPGFERKWEAQARTALKLIGERFLVRHTPHLTAHGSTYEGVVIPSLNCKITSPLFRQLVKRK